MKTQLLTDKECAWLERLEKEIDNAWRDLSPWEQKFAEDLLERFRRYGDRTRISVRQWGIITRISEKVMTPFEKEAVKYFKGNSPHES